MKFLENNKLVFIGLLCTAIVIWFVVFTFKSYSLDKELNKDLPENFEEELNGIAIQDVKIKVDDKEIDLQDLLDTDYKSGDIVDVVVTYDNDEKVNKQAYVSVNDDVEEVLVKYEDGDYGQVKLPAKDVMSPKEFKEKFVEDSSNSNKTEEGDSK